MKALVIGKSGQLAQALLQCAPADADVIALGRGDIDLFSEASVVSVVRKVAPQLIINAAAYTAVDDAEVHEADARALNATAVTYLRRAADETGAKLTQLSTDFVFDGESGRPYKTDAAPHPKSVYGQTKLAGELAAGGSALIVRTSWLYSAGQQNFPATVIRLLQQQGMAKIVTDQIGTPTAAAGLAEAIWTLLSQGCAGIYHYSDSGVASWYDFAVFVRHEAVKHGLVSADSAVLPISSAEYPTRATRPPFSVLDKSETIAALGAPAPHWSENLSRVISEKARG